MTDGPPHKVGIWVGVGVRVGVGVSVWVGVRDAVGVFVTVGVIVSRIAVFKALQLRIIGRRKRGRSSKA